MGQITDRTDVDGFTAVELSIDIFVCD